VITDCHIHIQPLHMFRPQALDLMKKRRPNFEQIAEFTRSPKSFLEYLDTAGVDRAVLINYVAPDVIGFTSEVNQFIADYVKADPKRLIPCGGIQPPQSRNIEADIEQILRLKIRMIKIHPPHELLFLKMVVFQPVYHYPLASRFHRSLDRSQRCSRQSNRERDGQPR
jgi:predicted TIM-barrel fold metal-dependent hydrolase